MFTLSKIKLNQHVILNTLLKKDPNCLIFKQGWTHDKQRWFEIFKHYSNGVNSSLPNVNKKHKMKHDLFLINQNRIWKCRIYYPTLQSYTQLEALNFVCSYVSVKLVQKIENFSLLMYHSMVYRYLELSWSELKKIVNCSLIMKFLKIHSVLLS